MKYVLDAVAVEALRGLFGSLAPPRILDVHFVHDLGGGRARCCGVGDRFSSDGVDPFSGVPPILFFLFLVGIIIPSIAVQVRRLHDQNMRGWWVLLGLIPYVGGFIMLVFMLIPGTAGPNRFGPDPKQPEGKALGEVFS